MPTTQVDLARGSTASVAGEFAEALLRRGLGPLLATPCGVLAPLLKALGSNVLNVPREETAIGVAAGAAMAGRRPVVLMQNSGFGASINALASLVQPYGVPMLLVVSLRGTAPDSTTENLLMGSATAAVLDLLGIPHRTVAANSVATAVAWAFDTGADRAGATALLVPPSLFGWTPA